MGLLDKAVAIAAKKYVSGKVKDIQMGKMGAGVKSLWGALDGWKSWLVAVAAVYKLVYPNGVANGGVDAAFNALGWNTVTGAFDPQEVVVAGGVIVALGHRFLKALQQFKAGVPAAEVLSEKKV